MAIVLTCECGVNFKVGEEARGHSARCPECSRLQRVAEDAPSYRPKQKAHLLEEEHTPGVMFDGLEEVEEGPTACPACGTQVKPNEVVCSQCGHNVQTGATLLGTGKHRRRSAMPVWMSASTRTTREVLRGIMPRGVIPTITGSTIIVAAIVAVLIGGWWWSSTDRGKKEYIQDEVPKLLSQYISTDYNQTVSGELLDTIQINHVSFAGTNDGSGHQTFVGRMTVVSENRDVYIGSVSGKYHPGFMWFNFKITDNLVTAEFDLEDEFFSTFRVRR